LYLAIHLKAAKALGIAVANSLLLRADEIIANKRLRRATVQAHAQASA